MAYRLGIDIGGTFTDALLVDEETGELQLGKVSSTPDDPSLGFMELTRRMLANAQIAPDQVRYVVHGTTVATNAIIENKGAPTGFITTEGFRDMLEIARQIRPSLYDLHFEKPRVLVPRELCFGVPERLDYQGEVITPLDEAGVRAAAEELRNAGVVSIAVCLLHAYRNPDHERRVAAILHEVFPTALISLSSDVAPEFREYLRASTTIINASIQPIAAHYLRGIEARLRAAGVTAELLVMQSSGGVFSFAAASQRPVYMVESGPAAGVNAATYLGGVLGYRDILSFDMGGTTAKASLIENGTPRITKDYEVGVAAGASTGRTKGSGYPVRTPVIDLVEIGAGGGSIAWVDSGQVLRVGPRSAGADPGPVCYGRGGTEPTVTDANLVLGRLNPAYFLGGEIPLDVAAAREAIQCRCAEPLGSDVVAVAHGIVEIANAAMVSALRLVSVQRGYDPRDFVLVAFGGAGPVHANRLAAEIEITTTLIPLSPGITSALGLLVTDLTHDYSTTLIQRLDLIEPHTISVICRRMEAEGQAMLAREGVLPMQMRFLHQAEMRYVGQSYELTIPLPTDIGAQLDLAAVEQLQAHFHREHDRVYGTNAPDEAIELVNLRLTAIGQIARPQLRTLRQGTRDSAHALKATRPVYFAERDGYVDCPIYDRYRLAADDLIVGPAIVEEFDSTAVIHPGYAAAVDRFGNLLLRPA